MSSDTPSFTIIQHKNNPACWIGCPVNRVHIIFDRCHTDVSFRCFFKSRESTCSPFCFRSFKSSQALALKGISQVGLSTENPSIISRPSSYHTYSSNISSIALLILVSSFASLLILMTVVNGSAATSFSNGIQ